MAETKFTPFDVSTALLGEIFGERHPNPKVNKRLHPILGSHKYYGEIPPLDEISRDPQRSSSIVGSIQEILSKAEPSLPERKLKAFRLRFDIEHGLLRTHTEVGREMGITSQGAKFLEDFIIRRLRHPRFSKQLKPVIESLYPKDPS